MSNTLMAKPEFDWTGELEKTVVNSLVTTFGLDFLLFEDKRGGDVDTINNVRQGIYTTDEAKNAYDSRGDYDGSIYRTHKDYKEKGRKDKKAIENGELYDAYNKNNKLNRKREIDHTISAKEIHDDAGRVLANVDGVEIANRDYNLNTTTWDVNNPKREHSVTKFINEIAPQKIKQLEKTIENKKNQISKITGDTPEERHKREKLSKEIETHENQKKELESILENKEDILAADKKAREEYNKEINWKYYTSSKFFKSTALAAGKAGLKMGTRQALGLVLAEIWFELRERIPEIYQNLKQNFTITKFLEKIAKTLSNIFERVKERFKDLLTEFKDGAISGFFSNISTTIMNIFLVSEKMVVKLMREMWNSIVSAIKLITFNPENLNAKELFKAVLKIISGGLSALLGTMLNAHLNTILVFPMGDLIATFVSALATGLMTVSFAYFIENGLSFKKLWEILNLYKNEYELMIEHMEEINAELDRYLLEWAKIEFNLNPNEIAVFTDSLEACNSELERSIVLEKEIHRRNIELPYEPGNEQSTRNWLASLAVK